MNKLVNNIHLKNIFNFFKQIDDIDYCLIKKDSNFPKLLSGSDLDIVVSDINFFTKVLNNYFVDLNGYSLNNSKSTDNNAHYDIYFENELLIKLDLHFKKYDTGSFVLKRNYYEDIFHEIQYDKFYIDGKSYKIKIPNLNFEYLIRVIEYNKYPFKKHHLKYIKDNFIKQKDLDIFISKYIDIDIFSLIKINPINLRIKNIKSKIKKKIKNNLLFSTSLSRTRLRRFNYKAEKNKNIDIGWMTVETSGSIVVPIDLLLVNLKSSGALIPVHIKDTPHFDFIKKLNEKEENLEELYKDYLVKNHPEINPDEKIKSFKKLNNLFIKNKNRFDLIIARDIKLFVDLQPVLLDGVHRLSIMYYHGVKEVKCLISDNR